MSRKHPFKYIQKYYLFIVSAMLILAISACSMTRKVPEGEFLLTKNKFKYEDKKLFADRIPDLVSQKPNKKFLWVAPVQLWLYNMATPKYDTILLEYMTYPRQMRSQGLRDSLFIKYGHPEYVGDKMFWDRFLHTVGKPPVILEQARSETSANNIRKFMVYKGYWDANVKFKHDLDSAAKKAQVTYNMTFNDPTHISEYYYNIPDPNIKKVYENKLEKSIVRAKDILDQENLDLEAKRITDLMRENGYYTFNRSNQEIYFTADTLTSRKQVPLTIDITKDSLNSRYKLTTIGDIDLYIVEKVSDTLETDLSEYKGVRINKLDNQFKDRALWHPVIIKEGDVYSQKDLDLTKRNILALNNFSILSYRERLGKAANDSILDVRYLLTPLPKFELRLATDVHYSQILNFGFSPSVELTRRNVFGGAENLSTSVSGIIGTTNNAKNPGKAFNAYEISAQANLKFPRFLLPANLSEKIPKRFSPTTVANLGTSFQNNIGLGRINFNTSLDYAMNVNDIISHRLSLFNTQLSITRDKDKFYEIFPAYGEYRDQIFELYFQQNPALGSDYENGVVASSTIEKMIVQDTNFQDALNPEERDLYINFRQTTLNKDRQTQDVFISSVLHHFTYNQIGRKDITNPFYLSTKVELAGNLINVFASKFEDIETGINDPTAKGLFDIPYSQFAKFDVDVRKYFRFFDNKHTLALRQFVGVGVPYGNSSTMPFVRSYYNGGSNDIRAWRAFEGLGPADVQLDQRIRSYMMGNIKLTSNIEYRFPFNEMFEGAVFTDAGNIWSLKDTGIGDGFKFNDFLSEMGVGSGLGLRINVAYITVRLDLAYKIYDPNQPVGEKWRFEKIQPLKPTFNLAFGYPF